jgi:hypothetical protein
MRRTHCWCNAGAVCSSSELRQFGFRPEDITATEFAPIPHKLLTFVNCARENCPGAAPEPAPETIAARIFCGIVVGRFVTAVKSQFRVTFLFLREMH